MPVKNTKKSSTKAGAKPKPKRKPKAKPKTQKLTPENKGRQDWQNNNYEITSAWLEHLQEHKRPPTYKHLSEATGIPYVTIVRHMNDERTLNFMENYKGYEILVPDMVAAIFRAGMSGKTASQKLFMELFAGYKPGMSISNPDGSNILPPIVASSIEVINKYAGKPKPAKKKIARKAKKTNREKLKDLEK